jgi:uncharacterized membrane protein
MSTNEIASDLVIDATVDEVWALTVDVERWPELTPTMTSVERLDDGPLRVGSTARVVQPKQRPTVWTVTALDAPHTFEWEAKVLGVTMVGSHHLVSLDDGARTRNELRLRLSGFGSGLLRRVLGGTFREAIQTENEGFKRVAEAGHRATS